MFGSEASTDESFEPVGMRLSHDAFPGHHGSRQM